MVHKNEPDILTSGHSLPGKTTSEILTWQGAGRVGTELKPHTVFTPPKSSLGHSPTGSLKHLCLKTSPISVLDLVYFFKECENKLQKTNSISCEQREIDQVTEEDRGGYM